MSSWNQLEIWAQGVRSATRAEFRQMHQTTAQAAPEEEEKAQPMHPLRRFLRDLRQALPQGWPALEHTFIRTLNPKMRLDRYLPDASIH
jgi:hypothetical protein